MRFLDGKLLHPSQGRADPLRPLLYELMEDIRTALDNKEMNVLFLCVELEPLKILLIVSSGINELPWTVPPQGR